jgi:hypothetical protein
MDTGKREEVSNNRHWTEMFRIITPFLLVVITGFAAVINSRLGGIEDKLFQHLTNAELHFPRTQVVTKGEFDITLRSIERQLDELKRLAQK